MGFTSAIAKLGWFLGIMAGSLSWVGSASPTGTTISQTTKVTTSTTAVQVPKITHSEVKRAITDYIRENSKDGITQLVAMEHGQAKQFRVRLENVAESAIVLSPISAYSTAAFKATVTDPVTQKPSSYDIDFWVTPRSDGRLSVMPGRTEIRKVNGKKLFDYDKEGKKIPLG